MATTDYGYRFTDENYSTKDDVAIALETNLIDDTWEKILLYRKPYQVLLPLRNLGKAPFRMTLSSAILSKINNCDTRIVDTKKAFAKYDKDTGNRRKLIKKSHDEIVKILAQHYKITYSNELIEDIYSQNYANLSEDELRVARYIEALRELEDHYGDPVNEDLLTRLYGILSASIDSFVFYRETELVKNNLYSKEFSSAPVSMIESMMENLLDFIDKSTQSVVVKFACCYYSMKLIKPFDKYFDELAMLTSKMVIAHGDRFNAINDIAFLLPLEEIIVKYGPRFDKILSSIQKENDITYAIDSLFSYITNACNNFIDSVTNYSNDLFKEEARKDETIQVRKEILENVVRNDEVEEEQSLFNFEPIEEIKEEPKEEPKVEVKEEPKPVVVEPKEEKAKEKPVKEEQVVVVSNKIDMTGPIKNEREAAKYEKFLLERDPRLKKGQAHFYARHCTPGLYYTIKQYKRMVGCVYETARTSMDALAEYGYYEKQQIKNKFVYTPKSK